MPNEQQFMGGFNEDGTLQPFILPRRDWYDTDGRIYKDVLIENLNAIQDKLIQITELSPFSTTPPDISTVVYPDVDLDSPDNKIINLKSFLELTGLIGYPIECIFSGTTCKKISYYTNSHEYKTLTDVSTDASDSKPYVYLNYVTHKILTSPNSTTPTNAIFIGCFTEGAIKCVNSNDLANINLLYYLSRMNIETKDVEMKNSEWFRDQWVEKGWKLNGATVGATDLDTRSGSDLGTVTFNRIGRTSK